ncbi:MAG: hypothetical protein KBC69_02440 [Candidatus Magasanikbacteria bacterium]|nr:hypothetical protein [Candidatus Magasanikbacteria bacterium]
MKKYLILSLVAVMSFVSLAPALAREEENRGQEMSEVKKELSERVRDEKKELQNKLKEVAKTLRFAPRSISLVGTLVSVNSTGTSSTEITVNLTKVGPQTPKKWPPTSTVAYPTKGSNIVLKLTDKTALYRGYWGKMKLSEMGVGDQLHIVVKFNTDGTLNVRWVQDQSLHIILNKRGSVESVDTANSTFVLKQEKRTLTVKVSSATKFKMKGSADAASLATLKVGDTVSVEGIVNLNLKTVSASSVTIAKRPVVTPVVAQ